MPLVPGAFVANGLAADGEVTLRGAGAPEGGALEAGVGVDGVLAAVLFCPHPASAIAARTDAARIVILIFINFPEW